LPSTATSGADFRNPLFFFSGFPEAETIFVFLPYYFIATLN